MKQIEQKLGGLKSKIMESVLEDEKKSKVDQEIKDK